MVIVCSLTSNVHVGIFRRFRNKRGIYFQHHRMSKLIILVEQELLTLPEHLSSPPILSGGRTLLTLLYSNLFLCDLLNQSFLLKVVYCSVVNVVYLAKRQEICNKVFVVSGQVSISRNLNKHIIH
jgi:hypothetical protein